MDDDNSIPTLDELAPDMTQDSFDAETDASSITTRSDFSREDHIKVCVRIRPLLRDELSTEVNAWKWDQNTISLDKTVLPRKSNMAGLQGRSQEEASYSFDYLFKPEHTNQQIFVSVVHNVVEKSMQGFHVSVFTYGQTS